MGFQSFSLVDDLINLKSHSDQQSTLNLFTDSKIIFIPKIRLTTGCTELALALDNAREKRPKSPGGTTRFGPPADRHGPFDGQGRCKSLLYSKGEMAGVSLLLVCSRTIGRAYHVSSIRVRTPKSEGGIERSLYRAKRRMMPTTRNRLCATDTPSTRSVHSHPRRCLLLVLQYININIILNIYCYSVCNQYSITPICITQFVHSSIILLKYYRRLPTAGRLSHREIKIPIS